MARGRAVCAWWPCDVRGCDGVDGSHVPVGRPRRHRHAVPDVHRPRRHAECCQAPPDEHRYGKLMD
jgi:hypothetical protein